MARRKSYIVKSSSGLHCLKRKFDSEKQVKDELRRARKNGLKEYYECGICGYWHLTSQRTRDRNNRGKKN